MAWVYLLLAGLFEIGWLVGFKISQWPQWRLAGIGTAVVCMAIGGLLLWLAQWQIPIGTAYAVWAGIGAAGTFLVGVLFFQAPISLALSGCGTDYRWCGGAEAEWLNLKSQSSWPSLAFRQPETP